MNPIRRMSTSGVEVVIVPRAGAKVASIQVYVWAGSLHENVNEKGAAHFIEHMLFKGTAKRKVGEIGSLVEAAGGDINAYTTFDRTVYYLTLPSAATKLGIDVLADAVLSSTFDPVEIEREREVILEEIRRGNDDPGSVVGKKIFSLMYPGTEAGRPIIGSIESVTNMSRDDLLGFYNRNYVRGKLAVVFVGDVNPDDCLNYVEEFFPHSLLKTAKQASDFKIDFPQKLGGGSAVIEGDYQQTRVEVAFPGPSMTDIDGLYVDLAAYILGGSEISRLQRSLRDRDGVVSAIGCSAYSPSFRGLVEISASVEANADSVTNAIKGIGRELATFVFKTPATQQELDRARAAFHINRVHREETVDGVARATGLSLMTPLKEKFEDTYEKLNKTALVEDVMEAFARWFSLDHICIVALGSTSLKLKEDSLKKAFLSGWNEIAKNTSLTSFITPKMKKSAENTTTFQLKNGVKVIYRHLADTKMFSLMATTQGGLRFEDTPMAGIFSAVSGMLGLATDQRSFDQYTGRLEDLGSVVSGFSGKDSCGWEVHSILENAEETLGLWSECLLNPVIPEEQWASQKRETLASMKMQQDSASYRCMRLLSEKIYGQHPYSAPISGWQETVEGFSEGYLTKFYKQWRDDGSWIIAASGGLSPKALQSILEKNLSTWKPNNSNKRTATKTLSPRKVSVSPSIHMEKEQTHVALAWRGIDWHDKDRIALDVMNNILGGHGGRLFVKLRDEQSLAYSVSPLASQGCDAGMLGAYIACKPDKVKAAIEGMKKELTLIASEKVSLDELNRAKQHIIGAHEINLQRTSSQSMTMGLMELYGLGWDDFKKYPEAVARVSIEDIQRVAKRFFLASEPVEVVIGPK